MRERSGVRDICVMIVVLALMAADFAAYATGQPQPHAAGWGWADSLGVIYAGWYFSR